MNVKYKHKNVKYRIINLKSDVAGNHIGFQEVT
jgi:hypothetical protein